MSVELRHLIKILRTNFIWRLFYKLGLSNKIIHKFHEKKTFPCKQAKKPIQTLSNYPEIYFTYKTKKLVYLNKILGTEKDYLEQYIIFPRKTKLFVSLCLFYEAEDIME